MIIRIFVLMPMGYNRVQTTLVELTKHFGIPIECVLRPLDVSLQHSSFWISDCARESAVRRCLRRKFQIHRKGRH